MLRSVGTSVAAIAAFLLLWELLVPANGWPNYVMASPSDLPAFARFGDLFLLARGRRSGAPSRGLA